MALALLGSGLAAVSPEYSPWSSAVNLGPAINSSVIDGCPFVAKNDLTLYVVSTRGGGYGGQDIYVSHRDSVEDPWGELVNLGPTINSPENDLCPTLAVDGHHLFFVSDRPGGSGGQDLYVARRMNKRDDIGWEQPVNLGSNVNSAQDDFTPTLFEDDATGTVVLYFSSARPGGMGGIDIYSSPLGADGHFDPATLVVELSTSAVDERPNVRRDGLELYFDSNRAGSLGAMDLWVTTRASTTDPWSSPVNVTELNTTAAETRPSLSFDGTTLYFGSTRPGGLGFSDIYVATRAKVSGPGGHDIP
jgi:Tol biopolymer transport system component